MLEIIKELFSKAETKSDLATVLIFGTAGFVLDAGLNIVGFLEPGYVGIASASGALGIKKAAESALVKRSERKKEEKRADRLLDKLLSTEYEDLNKKLNEESELFKEDIISIDDFRESINEIIKEYRERS